MYSFLFSSSTKERYTSHSCPSDFTAVYYYSGVDKSLECHTKGEFVEEVNDSWTFCNLNPNICFQQKFQKTKSDCRLIDYLIFFFTVNYNIIFGR